MNSTRCIALCLGLLPALSCLAGPAAEVSSFARPTVLPENHTLRSGPATGASSPIE